MHKFHKKHFALLIGKDDEEIRVFEVTDRCCKEVIDDNIEKFKAIGCNIKRDKNLFKDIVNVRMGALSWIASKGVIVNITSYYVKEIIKNHILILEDKSTIEYNMHNEDYQEPIRTILVDMYSNRRIRTKTGDYDIYIKNVY